MRLILASRPEGKEKFIRQIEKWLGKSRAEISVCLINEALAQSDDDCRWLLLAFSSLATTFGGKLTFANLRAVAPEQLKTKMLGYDLIWCFGGYTNELLETFEKTGFSELLPKLLAGKIWVGSSAGACVLAKNYLGLLDFAISPHEKVTLFKENTYFLTDSAGLIVDNHEILLIENAV